MKNTAFDLKIGIIDRKWNFFESNFTVFLPHLPGLFQCITTLILCNIYAFLLINENNLQWKSSPGVCSFSLQGGV